MKHHVELPTSRTVTVHTETRKLEKVEKGKLIVSAAKSLKGFPQAGSSIASYLYGTWDAGRFGLFASAIRADLRSNIHRIRFLAGQEEISFHALTTEVLPRLEDAGLCHLYRNADGEIIEVASLVLAYHDLLSAVSDFYDSRNPSDEDRACLIVLAEANEIPKSEAAVRQVVASAFGEATADTALQLAKAFGLVTSTGSGSDPLIYSPRGLGQLASKGRASLKSA